MGQTRDLANRGNAGIQERLTRAAPSLLSCVAPAKASLLSCSKLRYNYSTVR